MLREPAVQRDTAGTSRCRRRGGARGGRRHRGRGAGRGAVRDHRDPRRGGAARSRRAPFRPSSRRRSSSGRPAGDGRRGGAAGHPGDRCGALAARAGEPGPVAPAAGGLGQPWPGDVTVTTRRRARSVARLTRNAALGELDRRRWLTGRAHVGPGRMHCPCGSTRGTCRRDDGTLVLAGGNRVAVETDAGRLGGDRLRQGGPAVARPVQADPAAARADGNGHARAAAGNRVVVLDEPGRSHRRCRGQWLGETSALSAYAGRADPTGRAFAADLGVAPVLPLAPAHLRARREAGTGDVRLSWVRRSRADTDSWTRVRRAAGQRARGLPRHDPRRRDAGAHDRGRDAVAGLCGGRAGRRLRRPPAGFAFRSRS
jgi:hypothetical protein